MSDPMTQVASALSSLGSMIKAFPTDVNRDERDRYVVVFVRIAKDPCSLVLLTHEGKHDSIFLPTGKVEKDESPREAAIRELVEETGFELPSDILLCEYVTIEMIKDNSPVDVICFVADVSLAVLFGSLRNKDIARKLAAKVRTFIARSDSNVVPESVDCPIATDVKIPIYDWETRSPNFDCFSFGMLVTVKAMLSALYAEDGLIDGYPLRFSVTESPLWKIAIEIYSDDRPISEIMLDKKATDSMDKQITGPTKSQQDLAKMLPKLESMDGSNDRDLYDKLKAAPHQLKMRGYDPESHDGAMIIAACFVGKLGSWFSEHHADRKFKGLQELIDLIKTSFSIRDFRGENLIKLVSMKQTNKLANYIRAFNDCYNDWKDDISFDFVAHLFMYGLSSVELRAELLRSFRAGQYDSLDELQVDATKSALNFASDIITAGGGGSSRDRKPPNANGKRHRDDDKDTDNNPRKFGGGGGRGNGKNGRGGFGGHRGRGRHGRGGGRHRAGGGHLPIDQKAKAQYDAAVAKLSPAELAECHRTKACVNCKETGHFFRDCTKPKPNV